MIRISGLSKVYKTESGEITALRQVDLHVKKGQIFGIIGVSGAGKSTLIRCINLLEQPTSGSIFIDGQEIVALRGAELRKLRSSLGMIFQHFNLLMQRTVAGNVAFPLEIAGVKKAEIKRRTGELLELVGLSDKAKSYPAQLSGGQKQRVAIARALACNPKVLLCDEATSALDPLTTKSILSLLKDINRKLGLTIVLITHEMEVIKEICDQVAVIDQNQIVEMGPVIDVIARPKSEAARRLFGNGNRNLPLRDDVSADGNYRTRVKVVFTGDAALQPVVSNLVRLYGINANIMYGNIDYIQGAPLGELVLELSGEKDSVLQALNYLDQLKLDYEVLAT
ncbi:MAG TPA: methionine ABC transporter ATP-binding protein [Bacilli bacterium]